MRNQSFEMKPKKEMLKRIYGKDLHFYTVNIINNVKEKS